MKGLFKLLVSLIVILNVTSCASVDCPLTSTVYSHWSFYSDGKNVSISDSVYVYALVHGRDTLLINRLYNASNMDLPFSYYLPADTFRLEIHQASEDGGTNQWEDLIIIKKDNLDHFNSPECGIWHEHSVTEVTHTHLMIDSIQVVNKKIDTHEEENFRIFFK